jgi:hypothetical protein
LTPPLTGRGLSWRGGKVRDNGCGIPRDDVGLAVAPYYTSKIRDFASLETLQSYGFRYSPPHSSLGAVGGAVVRVRVRERFSLLILRFLSSWARGEALHSVCNNCAELSIATRTVDDSSGVVTTFDSKGEARRYGSKGTWPMAHHLLPLHSFSFFLSAPSQ